MSRRIIVLLIALFVLVTMMTFTMSPGFAQGKKGEHFQQGKAKQCPIEVFPCPPRKL